MSDHMVIIAKATGDSESSSSLVSSASSGENPLVLSYESPLFRSEDESGGVYTGLEKDQNIARSGSV